MQFRIVPGEPCVLGQLGYLAEDHSFTFRDEELPYAVTTLQVNTLQLWVNEEGRVLYVWGYCPLFRFQVTESSPPRSVQGQLFVKLDEEIVPGVSKQVNVETAWPLSINPNNGWVCLGDPSLQADFATVEFAQSCVAVLRDGTLASLWLRPQKLPDRVLATASAHR